MADGFMKAVVIEEYGGPGVVQIRDLPIPVPGPSEVLVKVAVAGVNFMDVHTRQGKYEYSRTYPVSLPCVLGMEGAGTVVKSGNAVSGIADGDRVAWCISWGSYAEYVCVPQSRLARIPEGLSFELAAASLFQGATAHYLVHDVARLSPGSRCLIHAASGCVGQLLVQMAKRAGAMVIATAGTLEKAAVARQLGADHALLYGNGGFVESVRDITGGTGVDVAFDAVGKATLRDTFKCVRKRGLVVNFGSVSGSISDLDPIELGEAGSLFLTRPRLADHIQDGEAQRRAEYVFSGLLDGSLRVEIAERYGMGHVLEAHEQLETRQRIGKAVLVI